MGASRLPILAMLAALCAGPAAAARQFGGALVLEVAHAARPARPGEVVLLAVTASQPVAAVDGDAFGRAIRFWPSARPEEWHGLVGIGVDAEPGPREISVRALSAEGAAAEKWITLAVEPREFETRRLRVATRYVEPPADERDRIAREAKQLAAVMAGSRPERLWRGSFAPPVPGAPTSSFGRLTVLNGQPRGRHQGADFRAATGDPVRAPNAGQVVLAAELYFSGRTVVLDHGAGLVSLFAHLSRIAVDADVIVARGDLLGEAGATGRVTGPHLHWTVRLDDLAVDPVSLMAALSQLSEPPITTAADAAELRRDERRLSLSVR